MAATRGTRQLALGLAMILSVGATASQRAERQANILVLYGMRSDGPVHQEAAATLHRILGASTVHATLHEEFVDETFRARSAPQRRWSALHDYLAAKYGGLSFDVVMLVGPPALDFFESAGRAMLGRQPIVASLIPASRVNDFSIDPHMAVVADDMDIAGTLKLARRLFPERNHIFVITGVSAADSAYAAPARALGGRLDSGTTVTMIVGRPLVGLEATVLHAPSNGLFLYLTQSADSLGNEYTPGDIMERLSLISGAPMFAWIDAGVGTGAVGGRVIRVDSSIARAAGLALRVLGGERFGTLPRLSVSPSVPMLDGRALARWRIPSSRIPSDALVLNRERSEFQRYRTLVVLTVLLVLSQAAVIVALVVQSLRRRSAGARNRALIDDLRTSHDRVHSLAGRLIRAQEEERSRIGRELHDDVNQRISALAIALSSLRKRLPTDPWRLADEVSRLQSSAADLAVDVRELSHRLHSGTLHLAGLSAALQSLCSEVRRQNTLILELSLDGDIDSIPDDVALCLYRVAQEGVRNVVTHANASMARIAVARRLATISLSVADDGRGFDVSGARAGNGLGLISLEERVHIVNGEFHIESEPGRGTTILVNVSLRPVDPTYSPPDHNVANDRSAR